MRMSRVLMLVVACLVSAGTALSAPAPSRARPSRLPQWSPFQGQPAAEASPRYRPGEVLVVLKEEPPTAQRGTATALAGRDAELSEQLFALGISSYERVGIEARAARTRAICRLVSADAAFDPMTVAEALRASGRFSAACPNYEMRLLDTVPNDPFVASQWHLSATDPGAVLLPQAWDYQVGSPSVKICVLDIGIDIDHPDIAPKVWTNPGEIAGNNVDDDLNGYVDDVHGWDFGDNDADPRPTPLFEPTGIGEDVMDVAFHGTFAAGLAIASTNNAEGIAGVDWNARIVPVKISDANGLIYTDRFAAAMLYAAEAGAKVMSISLGVGEAPGVPEFFRELVRIAFAHDAVVVASAGNDGTDAKVYPAACDSVIAVASNEQDGSLSAFSNHGPWVTLSAPGGNVFSTIHQNYPIDELSQAYYFLFFGWDFLTPYMFNSGTSFSAPIVAGAACLVRAQFPSLNQQGVYWRLLSRSDAMGFTPSIGTAPYVNRKLNVLLAVTTPVDVPAPTGVPALTLRAGPSPFTRATTFRFTLPATSRARLSVFDAGGRVVAQLLDQELPAGGHSVPWDTGLASGDQIPPGLYHVRLQTSASEQIAKVVRVR